MSKLCEDFIKDYTEYLIQTDLASKLGNDANQAALTIKTQKLLLVMLKMVNKICDALEVRND